MDHYEKKAREAIRLCGTTPEEFLKQMTRIRDRPLVDEKFAREVGKPTRTSAKNVIANYERIVEGCQKVVAAQ